MRLVIQRVSSASVTIEGKVNGEIGKGLMVLAGIEDAEQLKRKRSASTKGKNNAGEHNPMFGNQHKESAKALQSYRAKNRPKLECPHCGIVCASSQFNRWHGDKCKLNPRQP